MQYYYAASSNGFYCDDINDDLPDDAIEITKSYHAELLNELKTGKVLKPDTDGNPIASDPPPPTQAELVAIELGKKNAALLKELNTMRLLLLDLLDNKKPPQPLIDRLRGAG